MVGLSGPFGIVLVGIATLSVALAFHLWRNRELTHIAVPLALLLLCMAGWTLAYAFELAALDLEGKALWAKVEFSAAILLPFAFLLFTLKYTGREGWLTQRNLAWMSGVPVLALLTTWTNQAHGLIWSKQELYAAAPLPLLSLTRGPGFWVVAAIGYALVLFGGYLLLRSAARGPQLYHAQVGTALVSILTPLAANGLSLSPFNPFPYVDLTPFTFVIGDLAVVWGLTHYHMLDVTPGARDTIIESMNDSVIVLNASDCIVDLNPAAERMIGVSAARAIGERAAGLVFDRIGLAEEKRCASDAHVEVSMSGGTPRHFDLHISPFYRSPNRLAGRILVFHDVTERRLVEQALEESGERLRLALAASRMGIWEWDLRTDHMIWSENMGLAFNRPPATIEGNLDTFLNLVHMDDRAAVQQALRRALDAADGAAHYEIEFRVAGTDGQFRWQYSKGLIFRDGEGRALRVVGVSMDTTERKRAEEALRQSEERYRVVSELASDFAYAFRIDSGNSVKLEWITEAFTRMTGFTQEQLDRSGAWILSLAHPEDRPVAMEQQQTILSGEPDVREFRILTRHNEVRWIRNYCRPVWDQSQGRVVGFLGAAQDITERKRAEARLERNTQELRGLYHMGQTVLSSLDLETVLRQVIEELLTLLRARDVSILLLDNRELVFAAVAGASANVLQGQRMPADVGVAGQVVRSGRPVRVSGNTARASVFQEIEELTSYHTHTLLAAPLKVGSEVIGVMEAVHTEPDAFSEDDLRVLGAAASWASIAIHNARQHQDLRRRLQESQAMAKISQALTETLELERNFQLIVETAQQTILHVERAVIHLLDEKEHVLRPVAVAGLSERGKHGFTMHPGEGIAGRVMAEGIVLNVPDITAEPRYVMGDETVLRSLLVAPVQSSGRRLGTLSVASTSPCAFTTNDERLLAHLGAQAAIAIEKARLYQAEREQRTLAEALRDNAAALSSTLNLGEILDRVLANVGTVVPHDAANIILLEGGVGRVVRCRGYAERGVEDWLLNLRLPLGEYKDLRQMVESRQPVVVPDTATYSGWVDLSEMRWLRSYVSAPICIKGEVIGFLGLDSATPGFFTETHAARLQTFADQAAISIQNANLFQSERRRLEKAVALQGVTRAISSHLDLAELVHAIVSAVAEIANYQCVSIYFVGEEGLRLMAQRGYQPNQVIELFPLDKGLMGRVVRTSAPVLVSNVCSDPEYAPVAPEIRSSMAVPLTHGTELRGVLLVETSTDRMLDQDDLDWLVGVGQQLSVALENARLYADLQNALRQEQETRDHLVQADKLAAIGQMAASVAHELNNPLQAIQGSLDLAEMCPSDTARQQHYLKMAKSELDRLTLIVRRMLDYYRPAKGVREWVDVCALVADVLALSAKRLAQAKISVKTDWEKGIPTLHAVGNQLKQVFLNIILNAVEAMPDGGELHIKGLIRTEDGKWLTITFEDTGVGIPAEDLGKIFEPFYTTRATGTGLGLAVSHSIITNHKGRLTVESVVGQGSTFTVWLPYPS